LGNLTLTGFNSELSNDSFEVKRRGFLNQSHLELNRYFQKIEQWKQEDIERRSEYLAEIALQIWPYFGDEQLVERTSGVKGRTPKSLSVLGQQIQVDSWRDVLEQTMNTIAELEPELFELIVQEFPAFVSYNKERFRDTRQLSNGAYIEVSLSAEEVKRRCLRVLWAVELSSEDWDVETV
jgi:hypothetical protein